MAGISPKLPLERAVKEGYALNKTVLEAIKQNLKMVILTSPGERVMDPEFGVGIKKYLFENDHHEIYASIRADINSQVERYIPFINIKNIAIRGPEDPNFISSGIPLSIQILYDVDGITTDDILEISTS